MKHSEARDFMSAGSTVSKVGVDPADAVYLKLMALRKTARQQALDEAKTPEERAELERRFATADSMARNRQFTVDPDPLGGE